MQKVLHGTIFEGAFEQMTDYILFDLDGTLTDPKEGIIACVKYALESVGIEEKNEQKLMSFIGPPLRDSFRDLYGFDDRTAARLVEKYRERFSSIGLFENRLYDGAAEMLKRLKTAGKIMALATSKPRVFAQRIAERYKIADYFDVMTPAELDGRYDRKNEVISYITDKLGSPDRERIVMVGDRRQDIDGAKACGIRSVGVRFGYAEPGELESAGADYICDDMKELCSLLISI